MPTPRRTEPCVQHGSIQRSHEYTATIFSSRQILHRLGCRKPLNPSLQSSACSRSEHPSTGRCPSSLSSFWRRFRRLVADDVLSPADPVTRARRFPRPRAPSAAWGHAPIARGDLGRRRRLCPGAGRPPGRPTESAADRAPPARLYITRDTTGRPASGEVQKRDRVSVPP